MSTAAHQLINQTSSDVEYYTPIEIIEAARCVLGVIDLDPASSENANRIVKAKRIYTAHDDGLLRGWYDRVWMNHPFGRAEKACAVPCVNRGKTHVCHDYDLHGNTAWIGHLETQYEAGNVSKACCVTYACTSETWFQPLARRPQCYLTPRTNYRLPDGTIKKGVSKGSVVTYYGTDVEKFAREFRAFGQVKVAI